MNATPHTRSGLCPCWLGLASAAAIALGGACVEPKPPPPVVQQPVAPATPATPPPAKVPPTSRATGVPRPAPALGPLARDEWTGALPAELSQVYAFIACASADNRDGRWSEPAWVKRGVARLGDERALGMYRMGWCRFYVDSPFGKDTAKDGNPAFTFFGALRTPPDSPWNKGFVASWSAVTSKPDAYVVAYMGNPTWDTEFVALAGDLDTPADKAPDRAGAMRMLREAIRPLVEAGFKGLAIDALSNLPESHVVAEFLKAVQAAGIDVYIEATPVAAQPWLARFGTIRTTWFARWAPGFKGLLDPAECRGARIVLYEGTSPWPEADRKPYQEWVRRWVHECLARGEHPAIDAHSIVQPKRLFDLK